MQKSTFSAFLALRPARRPLQVIGQKRTWHRSFHSSRCLAAVKPFILADIGEGITEVQIIQWFVQPGARVEQFDKLCEVQSDKASVEITSRFDGVIKKLHYEQDDTAKVGKPLCDIDITGEISPKDEALLSPEGEQAAPSEGADQPQEAAEEGQGPSEKQATPTSHVSKQPSSRSRDVSNLATPAVRGLLKELNVNIEDVQGTGKDGRVLKEDVHNYVATRKSSQGNESPTSSSAAASSKSPSLRPIKIDDGLQKETPISLNPIQAQMFKTMTRSLSIPHFMYGDEVNLSPISTLRKSLNSDPASPGKLSFLPFVIKAVSLALYEFPLLNARVEVDSGGSGGETTSSPPRLVMREKHNIGVAMDTPQGLLVPNLKNVGALSIRDVATELARLQERARAGRLGTADLTGGTITVSNIGSVGGTYVAPVIVQGELAILGMGRARAVPSFDDSGAVVRRSVASFSWSADHRVVDGATMARMADRVRAYIETPGMMMADMR